MEEKNQDKQPETKEIEDGGVEVSLEEEGTPVVPEEEKEPEPKAKEEPKQDSFKNKVYAQDRIISKQQKEIDDLREQMTSQPKVEETKPEDFDKDVQSDWQGTFRKIAKQEAENIYKADQAKIQKEAQERERKQVQETNEQKVVTKYPELNDSSSEHTQIWFDVLNKNPRWRTSPDGPILVMREMEDVLRVKGYDIDGRTTKAVNHERERLANANATSLGTSRPTPSNKVILSREQREFCDTNGISYEEYARTLKKTAGGGLEL